MIAADGYGSIKFNKELADSTLQLRSNFKETNRKFESKSVDAFIRNDASISLKNSIKTSIAQVDLQNKKSKLTNYDLNITKAPMTIAFDINQKY